MNKIILIGGGGHCKSVIDVINSKTEFEIVGILDIKEKVGSVVNNISIIGTEDILQQCLSENIFHAFISVGSVSNPLARIRIYKKLKSLGFIIPNIIDKSAIVSENLNLGEGNFIGRGVIVNSSVSLGDNCILNSGCIIEHDCEIGDFVHIAPGVTLSGGVSIGYNSHIGTNATIIQGKKIGHDTVIGAGSVVVKDIASDGIAYGNPCRNV